MHTTRSAPRAPLLYMKSPVASGPACHNGKRAKSFGRCNTTANERLDTASGLVAALEAPEAFPLGALRFLFHATIHRLTLVSSVADRLVHLTTFQNGNITSPIAWLG